MSQADPGRVQGLRASESSDARRRGALRWRRAVRTDLGPRKGEENSFPSSTQRPWFPTPDPELRLRLSFGHLRG